MPTITSTTSGPFNSGTTWVGGSVPADRDSFIINYGHIVTISDDQRRTAGFDDSFVRGKLQILNGGSLRMSGILYVDNAAGYTTWFSSGINSAGFFRMDPGSLLEFRGTNAEQHRLQIQNHQYVTCEIEGTNPNPRTTLVSDTIINGTFFIVTNSSGLAPGDWITIYRNDYPNKDYKYIKSDEGMWIHDIDYHTNTIYPRNFVSPSCTIIAGSGSSFLVSDASVMRNGYSVIFGTGVNRNIRTISDINYTTNYITFNSGVPGSPIGETIYRTSLEKAHIAGDSVLRIAATLTADSNQGSNTLTINNINGFNVGDLILVPINDPNYNNATSWDNVMDYTITAINSGTKTLTIGPGFSFPSQNTLQRNAKAGVGGIVVNLNRDTKITAPSGTTYGTDQTSFIYSANLANNFTRRCRISDCVISVGSNNNSADYGNIGLRGSFSYQNTTANGVGTSYTSYFDGIVVYPTNRISRNWGYWWDHHYLNIRNCVSYNTTSWAFARYGNDHGFFNNIAARYGDSIYLEGMYGDTTEVSYNFCTRCANISFNVSQWYDPHSRMSNNIIVFNLGYPFYNAYNFGNIYLYNNYINYFNLWPYSERASTIIFNNCYFGNDWDVTNYNAFGIYNDGINLVDSNQGRMDRKSANTAQFLSVGHNFKYGKAASWNRRALRTYDESQGAYRVYPDRDQGGWMGFTNDIYIPANSRVFITGRVKTVSGNTNYPYMYARHILDGVFNGSINNNDTIVSFDSSTINSYNGFRDISQRFTNSANTWETKTLTLPKLPFDYYLVVGIGCEGSANNSRLGWWEQDLDIGIELPNGIIEAPSLINYSMSRIPVRVKNSANQLKTILGG